jgi:hypothetical protein
MEISDLPLKIASALRPPINIISETGDPITWTVALVSVAIFEPTLLIPRLRL